MRFQRTQCDGAHHHRLCEPRAPTMTFGSAVVRPSHSSLAARVRTTEMHGQSWYLIWRVRTTAFLTHFLNPTFERAHQSLISCGDLGCSARECVYSHGSESGMRRWLNQLLFLLSLLTRWRHFAIHRWQEHGHKCTPRTFGVGAD
jgi:hypothetical protein